ncbi:hypothetical protein R1T16_13075 [Flavobacterium sp. DG1-102-2]|uniref:hypothetical protein n=1 Tax=Flavobacterium sp. DG1-102-2 TaxID=3081663 RepID=UPI00294A858B|nr:hypothetical protein [Flavobacterium sp. DG1-102-2]MDV6169361.1 hypothetical protein [Flavobacterium sp. DG1-102-2]
MKEIMGSNYFKRKAKLLGMPAALQLAAIKKAFPETKVITKTWSNFEITIDLQPSPFSEVYKIKIVYKNNLFVKIFVVDKILEIAPNRKKLPHIYNSKEQQLCLYSPSKKDWKATKYISDTIIPWASEWLFYYELWLPYGEWYGGGHNEYPSEINTILTDE